MIHEVFEAFENDEKDSNFHSISDQCGFDPADLNMANIWSYAVLNRNNGSNISFDGVVNFNILNANSNQKYTLEF